ncbi:hypothetical protein SAMN06297387_12380 [Streptomyces zhaozhouensis]|uniref:Uncharacterized protein n=1 Tax=Streptomyces zhaozhouensis TaxID=1300267 RepID=A0A286E4M5_9ACTN|nr:hypothetical protein [Streptomyces zhaozhouensis]SOD65846.1 hypothetical protein SAMN06297387_12380 [Streptomyces zhaozhouensis]
MYGAVVAASALVLTACGGDDSGEDDEIAGVQSPSEEPEASEDPEPTEEPADDRPEIDLGPDLENVYESHVSGGDPEDAIVESIQGFNDATDEAIVSGENDRPALRYYTADEALMRTLEVLSVVYENGESSTGTTRYTIHSVSLVDDTSATFTFCRDYRELDVTDFETGEVIEEADPNAVPDRYVGRVELNEEDVWQVVGYDFEQHSPDCA